MKNYNTTRSHAPLYASTGSCRRMNSSSAKFGDTHAVVPRRVLDKDVEERFRIKLIHEGSLPPCELLYTGASAVVDCGNFLYVWIGKESTSYQRKLAAVLAKVLPNASID